MKFTTLQDALSWAESYFSASDLFYGHGTDNPWDEAVALARAVCHLPPDVTRSALSRVLSDEESERFINLATQRVTEHIPLPYLTQEAWFAGLSFYVDQRVIIPRSPFAELILNQFKPWLRHEPKRILDLCTGSGCMAIACAKAFPNSKVDAVDISLEALAVAQTNLVRHACEDRVELIHSDLFGGCRGRYYDLIVSNPPYVGASELAELPLEYRHEPKLALVSEDDGLSIPKQILQQAYSYLSPGGLLFLEVGNSAAALVRAFPEVSFMWVSFERGGDGVLVLLQEDEQCWKNF